MSESEAPASSVEIELFRYYVEQARHTERLRVEIAKFFTTLMVAVLAAIAWVIENGDRRTIAVLIGFMAFSGLVFSLFSAGIILAYQLLINEWVEKKELLEGQLYKLTGETITERTRGQILLQRKPKPFILYGSVGVYFIFALLFLVAFFIAIVDPGAIQQWFTPIKT